MAMGICKGKLRMKENPYVHKEKKFSVFHMKIEKKVHIYDIHVRGISSTSNS